MNLLDKKFEYAKSRDEGVLIAYFPLGEPGFDPVEMAETYYQNGVDVLEIAYPVADPFVDGAVVAGSMHRILEAGFFTPDWYFEQLERIKAAVPDVSLEVFGYSQMFNSIKKDEFYGLCKKSGVDSILIADLDGQSRSKMDRDLPEDIYNLRFMPFHYSQNDLEDADKHAKGYIFLQATDGVTGARESLDERLGLKVEELKKRLPKTRICPGFGISTENHCKSIMSMGGDGVIIGSLVVDTVYKHKLAETGKLLKRLKDSLKK